MTGKDIKKFWGAFLLTLLLAELWAARFPVSPPRLMREILLEHQLGKLNSVDQESIVLVGDSSLGNGVDAVRLSQLLERPVFNLALTGTESFAGDYLLLETLFGQGVRPRLVVSMHSTDTLRREIAPDTVSRLQGELAKQDGLQPKTREDVPHLEELTKSLFSHLNLVRNGPGYRNQFFQPGHGFKLLSFEDQALAQTARAERELSNRDYLPQADKPWKPSQGELIKFRVQATQRQWLARLDALCKEHQVPLMLVGGPLYEGFDNAEYRADYLEFLRGQPVPPLTAELFTFPLERLGDEKDHLDSVGRQELTVRLASDILKKTHGVEQP